MGYTSAVRKCIHIEIRNRFSLIHEREWTGNAISIICKRYGVSRKTYYKWKNRYLQKGIEGLSELSRRPHTIKYNKKVTSEIQETILDHYITHDSTAMLSRIEIYIGIPSVVSRTYYPNQQKCSLCVIHVQTSNISGRSSYFYY